MAVSAAGNIGAAVRPASPWGDVVDDALKQAAGLKDALTHGHADIAGRPSIVVADSLTHQLKTMGEAAALRPTSREQLRGVARAADEARIQLHAASSMHTHGSDGVAQLVTDSWHGWRRIENVLANVLEKAHTEPINQLM